MTTQTPENGPCPGTGQKAAPISGIPLFSARSGYRTDVDHGDCPVCGRRVGRDHKTGTLVAHNTRGNPFV